MIGVDEPLSPFIFRLFTRYLLVVSVLNNFITPLRYVMLQLYGG